MTDAHTHKPSPHPLAVRNCMYGEPLPAGLFSAGLHPWYLEAEGMETQWDWLRQMALHPRCVGIGECGLDRLRGPEMELQLHWLGLQASLASSLNKPLIIHCVRAFDVLGGWAKKSMPPVPCLIHGFRQKPEVMQPLQKQGFLFSFGIEGIQGESSFRSFSLLPLGDFLLETDDSDTGIEALYALAALKRGVALEVLEAYTRSRFLSVFGPDLEKFIE